jgi:hypothetical protein
MFDARIITKDLESFREVLRAHNAVFKGEYALHDEIYAHNDPNQGIEKIFLRFRFVSKNIWNEKAFIVSIKQTELQQVGKRSIIPIKKQFGTEKEARTFIEENYAEHFHFLYEFDRTGWQYDLGTDQIDLEDIEGVYSVEFKSETEAGLKELLNLFGVDRQEVIQGPSIVAIKELLRR